jgi:hypothetical protein
MTTRHRLVRRCLHPTGVPIADCAWQLQRNASRRQPPVGNYSGDGEARRDSSRIATRREELFYALPASACYDASQKGEARCAAPRGTLWERRIDDKAGV